MKLKHYALAVAILTQANIAYSQSNFINMEGGAWVHNGNWGLRNAPGTNYHARQGSALKPYKTGFRRMGNKGLAHQLAAGASGSQRTEHGLGNGPIAQHSWHYTGFSIRLEPGYPTPGSWHVLHQIQQTPTSGQTGNNPIIKLDLNSSNKFEVHWRWGNNGGNGNYSGTRRTINFQNRAVERGKWYDIIVGWRYSQGYQSGHVVVYIKRDWQNKYTAYNFGNIRVGYKFAPDKIHQNKFGIYKGADSQTHRAFFDEIRYSNTRLGARIPGSSF